VSTLFKRGRFMLDHRWAPEHMSGYLDGELGSRGRARIERHTKECAVCRGLLRSLRKMLDALQRLPGPRERVDANAMVAAVRRRLHEPTGA
jgi:anti-sigma factor RsiW